MTDIAENRRLIVEFMGNMAGANGQFDMIADDARWWIQGQGWKTRDEFVAIARGIAAMTRKSEMYIDNVTAEEDRVAVEAHSRIEMTDDRVFQNTYHFLFILRDGKIVTAREHFDTAYAQDFFGAEAQEALANPAA